MYRINRVLVSAILGTSFMLSNTFTVSPENDNFAYEIVEESTQIVEPTVVQSETADSFAPIEESGTLSETDISLIALVTMAEAEGESEEGKRLVIDTILNRMDSEYFPDTVYEVVYQRNQFSSVWNGRIDKCKVSNDICDLVREELENRTNNDVVFFCANGYSSYGVPMFQVGNHYFSSYE